MASLHEFNEELRNSRDTMGTTQAHAAGIELSFRNLVRGGILLGVSESITRIAREIVTGSRSARGIAEIFGAMKRPLNDMEELYRVHNEELEHSGTQTREMMAHWEAMVGLNKAYHGLLRAETLVVGGILFAVGRLHQLHTDIGKELVSANASWKQRIVLTNAILANTAQTGVRLSASREAARALVEHGFELGDSFDKNLRLVSMMSQGLGMSVNQSTELALVFEKQLGQSVEHVADGIARVVDDTALAADEAGRLASNLGRAIATLRPGIRQQLGDVTELVGRYEGVLKGIGGTPGSFTDLLTKMTTRQGMMGAMITGAGSPEFLASEAATKKVLQGFADYAKGFLGNAQGWDRALRLETLGEMFGYTGQQVNLMVQAVEQANVVRTSQITLEERFREQSRAAGLNVSRLTESLNALYMQAMTPLLRVVSPLVGYVADLVNWFAQAPGLVTGLTVVMGTLAVVSLPTVIMSVSTFTRALLRSAAAALVAAKAADAKAIADARQMTFPGMNVGPLGATSPVASILTRLNSPIIQFGNKLIGALPAAITLGIAGAIAAGLVGYWARESAKALVAEEASRRGLQLVTGNLKQAAEAHVIRAALGGDLDEVRRGLKSYQHSFELEGQTPASAMAKMYQLAARIPELVGRGRYLESIKVHSVGPEAEQVRQLDKLEKVQIESVDVTREIRDSAKEQIRLEKERRVAEDKRERERMAAEQAAMLRRRSMGQPLIPGMVPLGY